MAEGMTASDVALMARDGNDGWGNGMGFMWIFALLILANGGWGGWNNNGFANAIGYENLATSNEVQRGFDNQNSMANQREILSAVNQNFHDTAQFVGDKYSELQRDIAALAVGQANVLANQNQCCCDTRMEIQQGNFNLIQAVQQEGAATRALIQQDKIESLQQRVNDLNLQAQMAGVVRYPMTTAYNAGYNPFCNCGQGCC